MDRERIVVELPEVDRETFKAALDNIEGQAALLQPLKAKAYLLGVLLGMRKRLSSMTARHALLLCAALAFALAATPAPQTRAPLTDAQIASIDSFVTSEMARSHVPGAAVGIYSRGNLLLAKGYGFANVELRVPVKPETVFQSGSVGKQFVSAAIMMLVEEGRVSLNDSIIKYFPGAPVSWKPIRIKNLLSHTSGLAEYESPERTGPNGPFYLRLDYTESQLLRKIEALPIENPPGAKWNYRNTNYVLLGFLIHRVTGTFYADYLAKRIFKPLGMNSTRLISEADIIPNRAAGYQWEDGALKNQDWVSPTFNSTADGALYFNVLDLAKWDAALYTTQLLEESSLNAMWTVYKLNDGKPNGGDYGFGWEITTQNGHHLIEHGGAWQGFTSQISRYPNDSLAVVVLANSDSARTDYMAHVIAGLAEAPLLPQKLTGIADAAPRIAASLGSLLDRIASGADIRPFVSADFARVVTPSISARVQRRIAPLWPGGALTLVQRMPSPDNASLTVSRFRLAKGTSSILIWYGLDAHGKVDTLLFEPDQEYGSQ
ncbi:MAG TPA: serine hydrolase domain-containing protein [Candidatus Cybelea sp.]|nr:serine hydrolase domain-containing protein [Candidatus Cybelea sp.]